MPLEQLSSALLATLASEVRPGYVTLQIPPLENWEEPLRWLSRSQRERFEEAGFYEMLQLEISTKPPIDSITRFLDAAGDLGRSGHSALKTAWSRRPPT